jgi:UDP-N-acetylglucosamine diphosphorylase / glucose-1-phosphate thymidylyltransferase / UDP-N-acetylgalactosamine diphosphorylase / glucosamine-1-phosphate N-acetyltransferase / galactosamine-1-phosphate N-acetyltransferase
VIPRPGSDTVFDAIRSLWSTQSVDRVAEILPRDADSLARFYDRLSGYVSAAPRGQLGVIEPGASIGGEIVSMGPGSKIEAGAVVHSSCRLILGPRSVVRAGAVLRDEVVVGSDCVIGVHCEVVRSVVLGPSSFLGHFIYMADSVVGARVNVAGHVMVANTTVTPGTTIRLHFNGVKVDSRRTHLGALIGDDVRLGASTTVCPGCIVMPRLLLPPSVTLHGTIDARRRRALMKQFARTWVADHSDADVHADAEPLLVRG